MSAVITVTFIAASCSPLMLVTNMYFLTPNAIPQTKIIFAQRRVNKNVKKSYREIKSLLPVQATGSEIDCSLNSMQPDAGKWMGKCGTVYTYLLAVIISSPFLSHLLFVPTSLTFCPFFFSLSSLSHHFFANINLVGYHCLKSRAKAKYKTILEEKLLVMWAPSCVLTSASHLHFANLWVLKF